MSATLITPAAATPSQTLCQHLGLEKRLSAGVPDLYSLPSRSPSRPAARRAA